MSTFTISFSDLDKKSFGLVGGKGANLGELRRAGLPVPGGFCLTTSAFRRFLGAGPELDKLYTRLEQLDIDDRDAVGQVGADMRSHLRDLPMPEDVRSELVDTWKRLGAECPCAVRSSATAEDLAEASFAGQHDTFLNVGNERQLLDGVRNCWLSLFTDRAIGYRARNGFDHRQVELAVVVQRMVLPEVSGVMFTADPVGGHRRTTLINAAYGLGEAIVSGLVSPDLYRIEPDGTVRKSIAAKRTAIRPLPSGGVTQQDVAEHDSHAQALPDEHVTELARLGGRIHQHFGTPQDIEWAWADGRLHILQSRPITSLYPLPSPTPAGDRRLRVYFSLGHQQMMTDAMKPLALSVIRTYFPFGKRRADGETMQMATAGNRLFIDYTELVHTWLGRMLFAHPAGTMDKRMSSAFLELAGRLEFQAHHRFRIKPWVKVNVNVIRTLTKVLTDLCWTNMSTAEAKNRAFIEREVGRTRAAFEPEPGRDTVARVQRDMTKSKQVYYRLTTTQFSAAVARSLLERLTRRRLGAVDELAAFDKSLPGNVTTEMGMEIGDLADLARDKPALLALLQSPPEPFSPAVLDSVPGGPEFRAAFETFLDRYGMRCPGELDITRVRWRDRPTQLLAGIVANTRTGRPGEHRERFRVGEQEAKEAERRLLDLIRATRFGLPSAAVVSRLIRVYRTMMGMREHQKFLTVHLYDIYGQALRAEAATLADAGILASADDIDYFALHELRELAAGRGPAELRSVIENRKAEYEASEALTPPRLMTSDGEIIVGTRTHDHGDEGVLTGSAVSAGVVEGRARIVVRPEDAELEDGDILVAPFTDPAWTPLFSAVRGMVVEIGGLMTHGAVVARELGLPAVVGVDNATRLIPDGARIRVDGSQGVVELLKD